MRKKGWKTAALALAMMMLLWMIPCLAAGEENAARQEMIDTIISEGKKEYTLTGGGYRRAHYSGDIYICKNFVMELFNRCRLDYRMAQYPTVRLFMPKNKSKADCDPYSYGYAWEDIPASEGNPFETAAQFLYDAKLSYEENFEAALDFMRQVQRGDFFQMSAEYYYGYGAHSAIMIADYDPETNTVHWMDSNMDGVTRDGIRYGRVQFDAVQDIAWWADAFCKESRGATLYRLRDDIVYKADVINNK